MIGLWLNLCRFSLALVFVFSGFVKAIDPLGTQYKIQDYLVALGWSEIFPDFLPFLMAVLLGVVEFCLGVYLFFGIRRIIAPRAFASSWITGLMIPDSVNIIGDDAFSGCLALEWVEMPEFLEKIRKEVQEKKAKEEQTRHEAEIKAAEEKLRREDLAKKAAVKKEAQEQKDAQGQFELF